jgi:hypothetical protein
MMKNSPPTAINTVPSEFKESPRVVEKVIPRETKTIAIKIYLL